jgi:hypothetical protein
MFADSRVIQQSPPITPSRPRRLPRCLQGAQVLVIGRQMGRNDDDDANSATTDVDAVAEAVEAFSRAGGAVLYVHYSRDQTPLSTKLFRDVLGIGVDVENNYWRYACNPMTESNGERKGITTSHAAGTPDSRTTGLTRSKWSLTSRRCTERSRLCLRETETPAASRSPLLTSIRAS